jgi:hypothetical protein
MIKLPESVLNEVMTRDKFRCVKCHKPLGFTGAPAHRIANKKDNLKIHGKKIINHPFNIGYACRTNICNDKWNIGYKPEKCKRLVHLIENYGNIKMTFDEITDYINKDL